ncbi:MAG: hypothetical protein J6X55_00005, partial [Victivallales bacterium]|nr:hypothetical protein [Victivallales bacterium]
HFAFLCLDCFCQPATALAAATPFNKPPVCPLSSRFFDILRIIAEIRLIASWMFSGSVDFAMVVLRLVMLHCLGDRLAVLPVAWTGD